MIHRCLKPAAPVDLRSQFRVIKAGRICVQPISAWALDLRRASRGMPPSAVDRISVFAPRFAARDARFRRHVNARACRSGRRKGILSDESAANSR
jgi:hypothetical protein